MLQFRQGRGRKILECKTRKGVFEQITFILLNESQLICRWYPAWKLILKSSNKVMKKNKTIAQSDRNRCMIIDHADAWITIHPFHDILLGCLLYSTGCCRQKDSSLDHDHELASINEEVKKKSCVMRRRIIVNFCITFGYFATLKLTCGQGSCFCS